MAGQSVRLIMGEIFDQEVNNLDVPVHQISDDGPALGYAVLGLYFTKTIVNTNVVDICTLCPS